MLTPQQVEQFETDGYLVLDPCLEEGEVEALRRRVRQIAEGNLDFPKDSIEYEPDASCLELKSLKLYLNGFRNVGIFQENIVNRVLRDIVDAADPVWCEVRGEFSARGGLSTTVTAGYQRDED